MNDINAILAITRSKIQDIVLSYTQLMNQRHAELFIDFLPKGYLQVTLSSVPVAFLEELIIAKVHLGMLITLCDDFADNPKFLNLSLVRELGKIPFSENFIHYNAFNTQETACLYLAKRLAHGFLERIQTLPHYDYLKDLLIFDLQQFYNCNYYCALLTQYQSMANLREFRCYAPYNMGMIIAGMFDIAASPHFQFKELHLAREFLYLAQRFANICNTLNTLEREMIENDITNEVLLMGLKAKMIQPDYLSLDGLQTTTLKLKPCIQKMIKNRARLLKSLHKMAPRLKSFSGISYVEGLEQFQKLHETMKEMI